MLQMKWFWMGVAVAALVGVACGPGAAPTPTQPAGATQPPAGATQPPAGDAASRGQAAFTKAGCTSCHGDKAQGGVFPGAAKLASTALTCEQVQAQVRTPRDPSKGMPPFTAAQISDQEIQDVCTWVKSLP